ncbi:hypothetical protein N0V90_003044 [Kalmusia sp. IMI 367209]|nr:hypothetical protein N0V90_003044 [Kalmusia sp. IMI 367209]
MVKQKILLLGAHGETGGDILEGLLEDGNFEVSCLVQPSSAEKPAVKALKKRGLPVILGDLSGPVNVLAKAIKGFDTLISTISAQYTLVQLQLVDAAAAAGIKRFVPCMFSSVIPPGGIMHLRDEKEQVHYRIWKHHLPYTIIDVGYWHQLSWFRVPSGRLDYALIFDRPEVYGDGEGKTLISDKRDIGRFVARIVQDERTLNQKVVAWADEISQNEAIALIEKKTGEKVEVDHVSKEQLEAALQRVNETLQSDPTNPMAWISRTGAEYNISKFIREDGTLANAKYLGYLDARELYPELNPISFEAFLDELVGGGAKRPYEETVYQSLKGLMKEGEDRLVLRTG